SNNQDNMNSQTTISKTIAARVNKNTRQKKTLIASKLYLRVKPCLKVTNLTSNILNNTLDSSIFNQTTDPSMSNQAINSSMSTQATNLRISDQATNPSISN
ncbi:10293_t:CDS:1, partial [Scutellospora calospora]